MQDESRGRLASRFFVPGLWENRLIEDDSSYVQSFIEIQDTRIRESVERT